MKLEDVQEKIKNTKLSGDVDLLAIINWILASVILLLFPSPEMLNVLLVHHLDPLGWIESLIVFKLFIPPVPTEVDRLWLESIGATK